MALTPGDRNALEEARRSLGNCVLFRDLEAADKDALLGRARIRRVPAGETIFLMGSPGDSMMAVISGNIRISVTSADGREIVLSILTDRDVFGEIAMLDGKERTADARAMTPCTLAILERRDVLAFLERHPSAWQRLVEVLCFRLRHTDQHIAEIALLQLPVRLAKVLLRMSRVDATPAAGRKQEVRIQLSQRELGNFVGAARESVNKCLREWQRAGIVRIESSLITIADRDTLEELAAQG
jgi:CRP/FNR family transcriptional regulator, cyclic AMP receptor protein